MPRKSTRSAGAATRSCTSATRPRTGRNRSTRFASEGNVLKLAIAPFASLRRYVSREFWTTFAVLAEEHDWDRCETIHLPLGGDELPDALRRRYGAVPEVVLFWESYVEVARHFRALRNAGTRVYVMTDDLHHERQAMGLALRLAHGVLSTYAPRLGEYFPRVDPSRVTWVPHAAGPDFLLPVAEAPSPVVFVSGAMADVYPLRLAMRELALRRPELARFHEHPGYHDQYDYERDDRVGRGYAEAMGACLAAFTDALQFGYIVAKHFEIPATGALLIADRAVAPQLEILGFVDRVHYIGATAEDLESIVEYVLDRRNAAEINAVRRRGHALVHDRHTTAHRARQIDTICV
jgi:glycosyl transferase family 1